MTKKEFKENCKDQTFTGWNGKRIRINAFYFDYKETEQGRGYKYGVATDYKNCTKAELLDHFYNWIHNGVNLPYYVYCKFAPYDSQRFKLDMSFNFNKWK